MDKNDKAMITFWTSRDQHNDLKRQARVEDRSMSSLLRCIVEKYLTDRNKAKDPNDDQV